MSEPYTLEEAIQLLWKAKQHHDNRIEKLEAGSEAYINSLNSQRIMIANLEAEKRRTVQNFDNVIALWVNNLITKEEARSMLNLPKITKEDLKGK